MLQNFNDIVARVNYLGRYVGITAPANGDGHSTTLQKGPVSLFSWRGDQLVFDQVASESDAQGPITLSRRYLFTGDADPIYGETAAIFDLRRLGENPPAAAADAADGEQ